MFNQLTSKSGITVAGNSIVGMCGRVEHHILRDRAINSHLATPLNTPITSENH